MITVIGGANIDILGFSSKKLLMGDSNPGKVVLIPGGVGRNIAQRLASFTNEKRVELITILSTDSHSRFVKEETERANVSLKHSIILPGFNCPAYLAVMDQGDMVTAVNDMALLDKMTPEQLKDRASLIEDSEMVILDANLPQETLIWLTGSFPQVRFFAEPVSAAKCRRFTPCLDKLYGIKPNKLECEALTGMEIKKKEDALMAAGLLRDRGVKNVIISLGASGSVYASDEGEGYLSSGQLKAVDQEEINTNGAGDSYLAAVISSLIEGTTLRKACQRGSESALKHIMGNKE
jgi:pseudouridine kinase